VFGKVIVLQICNAFRLTWFLLLFQVSKFSAWPILSGWWCKTNSRSLYWMAS